MNPLKAPPEDDAPVMRPDDPTTPTMNVLVLGATGMLGHVVYRALSAAVGLHVRGTVRSQSLVRFPIQTRPRLEIVDNLEDGERLEHLFEQVRPNVVINCASVRKPAPADPMRSMAVLALLPQRLSHLCRRHGARLVQIGSDAVFAGSRGDYTEEDLPDANDTYGMAKLLGEVREPHAITLRTSIIGHELLGQGGLLEWFLAQTGPCRCYTRAIFSGFPTVVLARVIRDVILPRPDLHGVYHLATQPISKLELLRLVAQRYGKTTEIIADDSVAIDRSLNAAKFAAATGYAPPAWPELVDAMYADHLESMRE